MVIQRRLLINRLGTQARLDAGNCPAILPFPPFFPPSTYRVQDSIVIPQMGEPYHYAEIFMFANVTIAVG